MRSLLLFWVALNVGGLLGLASAQEQPKDDYQTTITLKGKIETVFTVKATVNKNEVDINIVNGFVPDEVLESSEKGKVTFRNFIFRENPTKYEKGKKYEYVFLQRGPTITESVGEGNDERVIRESHCHIYKLKK